MLNLERLLSHRLAAVATLFLAALAVSNAFTAPAAVANPVRSKRGGIPLFAVVPPPVTAAFAAPQHPLAISSTSPSQSVSSSSSILPSSSAVSGSLGGNIARWNGIASDVDVPATESSSVVVSLVERRAPTAEEIAAKKRNFNLWFWGGGVVAPFLATIYYFGPKFWQR